jgi:hypothetical protein
VSVNNENQSRWPASIGAVEVILLVKAKSALIDLPEATITTGLEGDAVPAGAMTGEEKIGPSLFDSEDFHNKAPVSPSRQYTEASMDVINTLPSKMLADE